MGNDEQPVYVAANVNCTQARPLSRRKSSLAARTYDRARYHD